MGYRCRKLFKKFALEDQHLDDSYRDIAVGQVEDWAEEGEWTPSDSGQPVGIDAAA